MKKTILISFVLIVLTTLVYSSVADYPASDPYNATYVWHFNEGSGAVSTDSINAFDFTYINDIGWDSADPFVGSSMAFLSGNNDHGRTTNTDKISGDAAICFFIHIDDDAASSECNWVIYGDIFSSYVLSSDWSAAAGSFARLHLNDGCDNVGATKQWAYTFSQNNDYHVCFDLDMSGGNCTLWVNGSYKEQWNCGGLSELGSCNESIRFGSNRDIHTVLFDGNLDELLFFNHTLTATQILSIYEGDYAVADPCAPTIDEDWELDDNITCTDKSIDLGTGQLKILAGTSLTLVNSNISLAGINVSNADTGITLLNISWTTNDYYFNMTG